MSDVGRPSPPPNPGPSKPGVELPRGACDAHCHVFGPFDRFPLPPDRSFTPSEAPEPALRRLHEHLGIERAVIVQSQGHGHDHGPLLDALATGGGRYRGVALLGASTGTQEIARFDAAGICGVRFSFLAHLGGKPVLDDVRAVIAAVRPFGWHVALHIAGADLVTYADFIATIEGPVVIDHMGRPDVAEGPHGPSMTALRRLLDGGRFWVKISGADRLSKDGPPFDDAIPIASGLVRHAPERVLWGTDWPHVNLNGPMPDDGQLVELLAEIAPNPDARRRILVDNPASFFGF